MGIVDLLRSSYQDLLDFLGMSNVLFTVLLLATISLMAFLLMLKRMGIILTPLNVRRINWPKSVLLYRQYQGEYHQVGPQFDLVRRDTAATFIGAQMFGYYYDEPTKVSDPTNCRAIIGLVLLTQQHQDRAADYVAKHVDYELKEIKQCDIYGAPFPFYNEISFILLPILAYPRLIRFLERNNERQLMQHGVMEYYDLANSKIQLVVPLTHTEQFQLTKYEASAKKEQ